MNIAVKPRISIRARVQGEPMTFKQCKCGRVGIGWTRQELAEKSGVSSNSIAAFECRKRVIGPELVEKLRVALESGGAIFMEALRHWTCFGRIPQ